MLKILIVSCFLSCKSEGSHSTQPFVEETTTKVLVDTQVNHESEVENADLEQNKRIKKTIGDTKEMLTPPSTKQVSEPKDELVEFKPIPIKDANENNDHNKKDTLVDENSQKAEEPTIENKDEEIKENNDLLPETIDHSAFDELLSLYVVNGKVDYNGFKKSEAKLDQYLSSLSDNNPSGSWSKAEKLAYWINVYNAFTIKLILKNYPVSSIKDIDNGSPWDTKWIKIGDKTYSLNNIENDIIRPRFNEPRIHFAVNCAAVSCPPIANQAFTSSNLESLLTTQTKMFINNAKFNTIGKNAVRISKIFDWYGGDFTDLIGFLNKYTKTQISKDASISYSNYDWSLNKK